MTNIHKALPMPVPFTPTAWACGRYRWHTKPTVYVKRARLPQK